MATQRYQRVIEYTYDEQADASAIRLTHVGAGGVRHVRTTDVALGFMHLDLDHEGRLVSIELLRPRRFLPDWEFRDTWDRLPPAEVSVPSSQWRRWQQRLFPPDPPGPRSVLRPIERTLELSYDDQADSAYLQFSLVPTTPTSSGFVDQDGGEPPIRLDFAEGAVVGIEVGQASRSLAKRMLPVSA